jgi:hypothetical protein
MLIKLANSMIVGIRHPAGHADPSVPVPNVVASYHEQGGVHSVSPTAKDPGTLTFDFAQMRLPVDTGIIASPAGHLT